MSLPATATGAAAPAGARRTLAGLRPAWLVSPAAIAGALVLLGAGLRLYALGGRGLWLDEVSTIEPLTFKHLSDVVEWCRHWQLGPLYFLTLHETTGYLGDSETALRLPSALAGSLGVYYGYRLGQALYGNAAGLLTALLVATMFFPVWYAQEARPYAFMILLATAQLNYAYRAVRDGRPWDWLGLAIATTLAVYNHYMALPQTAGIAVFVGLVLGIRAGRAWRSGADAERRRALIGLLAATDAGLLVALAYLPWLPTLFQFLRGDTLSTNYLARFAGHALNPADAVALLDTFGFDWWLAVLLAAGAAAAAWRARRGQGLPALLLLLATAGPLALLAVRLEGAVLVIWARYLSFLFPALAVLAALGAVAVAQLLAAGLRRLRSAAGPRTAAVAMAAVVIVTAVQTLGVLVPSYGYQKDDYRGAAAYAVEHGSRRDVIVSAGTYGVWPAFAIPYYTRQDQVLVVWSKQLADHQDLAARLHEPGVTVWVAVSNSDDPHGLRAKNFVATGDDWVDLSRYPNPELRSVRLQGVTLVRTADSSLSAVDQAITLLTWAAAFDRDLRPQLGPLFETIAPPAA